MDGYTGYSSDILELQINSAFDPNSDWGPYSSAHTYSRLFTAPNDGPANFRIFDGTGTTQNEGWFGDNSGDLSVNIDAAYAGTTGEDGCVTLENVPYGSYTAGELAQDGWTLTDISGGEGSSVDGTTVVVDSPTESFTLVNHHDVAPVESCVITSDTTTLEGGEPSFIASFIHSSWTALIDGASWIWGDEAIVDPVGTETQTFTKKFSLAAAPSSDATLQIAADNSYVVKVNGTEVGSDSGEVNYTADGQDTITIPASAFVVGQNTLEITVTNLAMDGGTQETNPAGLKYKLTIDGSTCTQDAPTYKVHIFKYLDDGESIAQVPNDSDAPIFPMVATYSITGVGTNLDPGDSYNLGDGGGVGGSDNGLLWAANTITLHQGDTYGTHEVTGGDSPVVANAESCTPGKYYLEGYKVGDSKSAAEAAQINETSPNFESISGSKYVIVVNKACPEGNDGEEPTHSESTVIVKSADLETQDHASATLNGSTKWFFYNDNTDVIDNTLGSFVTGPATTPAGTGSAEVGLTTNDRTNLATFAFQGITLSSIASLQYSAFSHSGVAGANESPYLVMNVDFNGTGSWQKRIVFVPADNGAVPQDSWNTYDAINGGNALWVYSGATWPGSAIPGSTPRTWNDILTSYPGIRILPLDGHVGIRTGEPGPTGYTADIDKFVIGITTGTNTQTTTYDFEPTAQETINEETSNVTHHSNRRRGQVLGVSTTTQGQVLGASCSPILTSYLRRGKTNPSDQVATLQNFLNGELGITLPVTGFFGPLTEQAVKDFQTKYFADILGPWVPFGLPNDHAATGYVYKTTLWMINHIACAEADQAKPTLP
jgi:hypothetical protein